MPHIGARLTRVLMERNVLAKDAASWLDIRPSEMSRILAGTRELTAEDLVVLCVKLDTSADYLLGLVNARLRPDLARRLAELPEEVALHLVEHQIYFLYDLMTDLEALKKK